MLIIRSVNLSTNDESSDSDKAPDVVDANLMVEHVAPADNLVLVVGGIVWTPYNNITADHFDGNYHSTSYENSVG